MSLICPHPSQQGPCCAGSVIPSHPSLHNAVVGASFRPLTRSPPRERVSLSCVRLPARTRHIPVLSLIGRNLLRVAASEQVRRLQRERRCTRCRVCSECLASDRSPRRITTPSHRDRSEMAALISLRNESLATTFYSTRRAGSCVRSTTLAVRARTLTARAPRHSMRHTTRHRRRPCSGSLAVRSLC